MRMGIAIVGVLLTGCAVVPDPECELGRFDASTQQAISERRVHIGMPASAVRCAWGLPVRVNRTETASGEHYQLVYEEYLGRTLGSRYSYVYVEGGRVVAIQD